MQGSGQFHVPITLFEGKTPTFPHHKRLGELQNPSGYCEEKHLLSLQGIEVWFLDLRACSLVSIPTEPYRSPPPWSNDINYYVCVRDSSVQWLGYGLDDMDRVLSLIRSDKKGCRAHPASHSMATGVLPPELIQRGSTTIYSKVQPVNAVWGNNRCLLWESYAKHKYTVWTESEPYVMTDGQSASIALNKAPIWGLWPDFYYCQTVAGLLMWAAVSDDRTALSFTTAAGPRQRSLSLVRVPWDSRICFTVPNLRLPFCCLLCSQEGGIRPRLHTGLCGQYVRYFIYKKPVRTSQETHYVSATETTSLMRLGGNSRCLLLESHGTHKYTVWAECRNFLC
jgi:hypothetical protein